MKKIVQALMLGIAVFLSNASAAQSFGLPWQKVNQVPSSGIFGIKNIYNEIYVTHTDKIYFSKNGGTTWTTSAVITPTPGPGDDIAYFNGRFYLASFGKGVFVSSNGALNWTQLNTGLNSMYPVKFVSRGSAFCVATDDNGVFKLNAAGTQWSTFNDGIAGNWGSSFNCLSGYNHGLMAGVGQNGYVLYREDTATIWKGSYLTGSLTPGLATYDIVNSSNYIWAITSSKVYASNNEGATWTHVSSGMRNGFFGKALLVTTTLYVAINYNNDCYLYKRNVQDPLSTSWTAVDTLKNFDCYGLSSALGKLYMATSHGLYYLNNTVITGLDDQEKDLFTIYPNPVANELQLNTSAGQYLSSVKLYDLQGREIIFDQPGQSGVINVSGLQEGLYFVEALFSDNSCQRKKIIIKR